MKSGRGWERWVCVARWMIGAGAMGWVAVVRAERLTVATYNVQNYVAADRMTSDGYRQDYPKPEAEKAALRKVIGALAADVLVIQEMGGAPYLEELRRDLRAEGCDYPHAVLANAADADRHVAVLSKRPFVAQKTWSDLTFGYFGGKEVVKRGLLQVSVGTEAGELTFFAVHLKSRFTDRADDPESSVRRAAEATVVRDAVLRAAAPPTGGRYLILGDCNDTKASKTLERLQRRGKTAVAFLLPAQDRNGEAWTHHYRKEDTYSRVDHILVSPLLLDSVVGGAAKIFSGEGVREASDHRPVLVVLELSAPAAGPRR